MVRYSTPFVYFVINAIRVTESTKHKSIVSRLLENYEIQDENEAFSVDDMFDALSDSMDQCVDAQMMNPIDPIGGFLNKLDDYCDESQAAKFEAALDEYNLCTGASLSDFIETLLPAIIGTTMTCAPFFYGTMTDITQRYYSEGKSSDLIFQKRMPDKCVDSLLGDNPFGNFFREHTIHPGKDRVCLAELGRAVPDCTLNRWPIPLPGTFFQIYACLENKIDAVTNQMCSQEIEAITYCLPTADDINAAIENKNANDKNTQCDMWIKACTIDSMTYYDMPSIHMLVPRPLSAAPFSDTCMNVDSSHDASSRLEAYQSACIPEEDRDIWSDGTGVPELSTSTYESSTYESSKSKDSESNSGSSFWKFSLGLFCGIVAAVGAAVFWDRRRKENTETVMLKPPNTSLS